MIPAIVISTGRLPVSLPSPDVYIADDTASLGIEMVRTVQQFLLTPPLKEPHKTVFIPEAHRLTVPAQNAFLKTLEEPPAYARIILGVRNRDQLLPTLVSRCRLEYRAAGSVPTEVSPEISSLVTGLNDSSLPHRTGLAGSYTKKDTAKTCCLQLIDHLTAQNRTHPSLSLTHRLALLNEAVTHLNGNAHPQLTMEHVFIRW